jgi:hypothetical protein
VTLSYVLGIEKLNDGAPRIMTFRMGEQRYHILELILAPLVKNPRPITAIYCFPILCFVVVPAYVVPYEIELVVAGHVPEKFSKTAKWSSARLTPTQPGQGALQFKQDADQFNCITARRRSAVVARKELRKDLQEKIIEYTTVDAHPVANRPVETRSEPSTCATVLYGASPAHGETVGIRPNARK